MTTKNDNRLIRAQAARIKELETLLQQWVDAQRDAEKTP